MASKKSAGEEENVASDLRQAFFDSPLETKPDSFRRKHRFRFRIQ